MRRIFSSFFAWLEDEDYIIKSPVRRIHRVRTDTLIKETISDEALELLRDSCTEIRDLALIDLLASTGMRVGELCGLTKQQLDFENRRIWVDHQLVRKPDCTYYVEKTKTESGCRFIPMTDNVNKALKNIIAKRQRPAKEWLIDGYSGFLLLDKNGNPKVAMHIEHHFQWALKKYRKLHPDQPLPKITPHVFRHTFCTKMAHAGMDIKSLQYLMGHSDAGVTMNVYTHATYDHAEATMQKILQLHLPEGERKSG